MKIIALTQDKHATVCDCHYALVAPYKWCVTPTGYAVRRVNGRLLMMHRVVNGTPAGLFTDHIDGDKLNNQCINLRNATKIENGYNRGVTSRSKSGIKGVWWSEDRAKWCAQIVVKKKTYHLGRFNSQAEAAEARKKAARLYHGTFSRE